MCIDKIIDKDGKEKYIKIHNKLGKIWIIPCSNMRAGLNLYQPSSLKGRFAKKVLPFIKYLPFLLKICGAEQKLLSVSGETESLAKRVFGAGEYSYSLFLGTPGVHQKITMQVFDENKIYGYCKFTDKADIAKIFAGEQENLKYLRDRNVIGIPKCLYCGSFADDMSAFVQDTEKTNNSEAVHELNDIHIDFLLRLEKLTLTSCSYERSDYKKTVSALNAHAEYLSDFISSAELRRILADTELELAGKTEFSFYHSDFTPWNMFLNDEKIFVFDFEYAKRTYPGLLDAFHFFTQTAIFEKRWSASRIYSEFKRIFVYGVYSKLFENSELSYRYYLIDIISMYALRNNGRYDSVEEQCMNIWCELLRKTVSVNK